MNHFELLGFLGLFAGFISTLVTGLFIIGLSWWLIPIAVGGALIGFFAGVLLGQLLHYYVEPADD